MFIHSKTLFLLFIPYLSSFSNLYKIYCLNNAYKNIISQYLITLKPAPQLYITIDNHIKIIPLHSNILFFHYDHIHNNFMKLDIDIIQFTHLLSLSSNSVLKLFFNQYHYINIPISSHFFKNSYLLSKSILRLQNFDIYITTIPIKSVSAFILTIGISMNNKKIIKKNTYSYILKKKKQKLLSYFTFLSCYS